MSAHPIESSYGHSQQRWRSVLLLHWALPPEEVRDLVPARLELDTFAGEAYVTAALFTVTGARSKHVPRLPGLSSFHEIDLHTFVKLDGTAPGMWSLSVDATNTLACAVARASRRLPYFPARAMRSELGEERRFELQRRSLRKDPATLSVSWQSPGSREQLQPTPLDQFLTERPYIYSRAVGHKLWRQPVRRAPWPLYGVDHLELEQTLDEASALPLLSKRPRATYSPGVNVVYAAPEMV